MSPVKAKDVQKKVLAHTVYKNADGKRLPGVTTVLGVLNKPFLLKWAWNLGAEGIDMDAYRDDLAEVGTLAHAMILQHLDASREYDPREFSAHAHDRAANSFLKYLEWEKAHKIEPWLVETPFVYDALGFGGTADYLGLVDGLPTIMDFKSGSGIYDEHVLQMAGYRLLYEEGRPNEPLEPTDGKTVIWRNKVEQFIVLNVGRSENEDFDERIIRRRLDEEVDIFKACLTIHETRKTIKKL